MCSELSYLGFVINEHCTKISPDKITAIRDYSQPKTVKQVRQFLGVAGWNRRFIADFSSIVAQITDLLKGKPKTVIWTKEAEKTFQTIK